MICQTTLSTSSDFVEGLHLDKDAHSSVRFHPAPPDHGIVFTRSDLPESPMIKCDLAFLRGEARWTSLVQDGIWVRHTEHILAAIVGNGIDNVVVEVTSDWIPIVSAGSCRNFSQALLRTGIKSYDVPRRVLQLRKPVYYEALLKPTNQEAEPNSSSNLPTRSVFGIPAQDFSVAYIFHVPNASGIRIGLAEYHSQVHRFAATVGLARTYFLQTESADLEKRLGSVSKDFIVVTPESNQPVVDEVARHKIVDFMGDLAVLGSPITGHFVIFRSGHRFHHDFARMLVNNRSLAPALLS